MKASYNVKPYFSSITTENRTFVGETGTARGDGWAGFRLGHRHELHVEHQEDGTVSIMLDYHAHVTPGAGLMLTVEQFEKWFRK